MTRAHVRGLVVLLVGAVALAVLAYGWSQAAADARNWQTRYAELLDETNGRAENIPAGTVTVTVPVMPEDVGR